ncbi:hypothetical protein [Ferrovibrio terrae]|uniref:phage major capsid protein n=1 Tax=Ferrovibrio terrae TaxID=2594003 RepID=UPI003137B4E7
MKPAIPAAGLVGLIALREAAAGSYQDLLERVSAAVRLKLRIDIGREVWPFVPALFPDSIIVSVDGKYWRYSYVVGDAGDVALGEPPMQVEESFQPVGTAKPASRGVFIEAIGGDAVPGSRYLIRVIRAGLSGNSNYYPDGVLREAVPLFEGARVFVKSDDEHLAGKGKDVRNLFGKISAPRFVEGKKTDQGEIHAELQVIEPEGALGVKLREAHARNMTDLFGFSIDAMGGARAAVRGNQKIREATRFTKVHSVDLIVEPGAGGGVIRLIEAKANDPEEGEDMLRSNMITFIEAKKPALLAGVDKDKLTDDEVLAKYNEAQRIDQPLQSGMTQEQLNEAIRLTEARSYARSTVAASNLPDAAKDKLLKQFTAEGVKFTEAQVDEAIKGEREYLAQFTESGHVSGLGDGAFDVKAGETRPQKVADMLDAFFDPAHKDHKYARSFRECYVEITGDKRVTGALEDIDQTRYTEALAGAQLSNVLGNALRRRLIADYRVQTPMDIWRRVATVANVNDFRTNERTRYGGYGDLPAVAESGSYDPLTSPGDEKASYAVTKRGGTESITLEMIRNDDAGVIRQVPVKLSRAGKRTLGKFVLDFLRTNPVIYDGVALFHATHGNLGTTALGTAPVAAGRLAMLSQKEAGSLEALSVGPRDILVPFQLEEGAVDLFRRNTNQDQTFLQSLSLNVVPVWYWTDANDWVLSADPLDIPGIEIGFLDGNEEPEIFVQDNPTVGSMFSNDKLTWKIRHIYGGTVTDYRGFYKAVVA